MRIGVITVAAACFFCMAGSAKAQQSHYLLARAFNQFTATNSIKAPDLTPFVEATHEVGVAGVNPVNFLNHAEVNSDSGHLLVTSKGAQPLEQTATLQPQDWDLVARMEEYVSPSSSAPQGMIAILKMTATGTIASSKTVTIKLNASLAVDGCRLSATRRLTPGNSSEFEVTDNCVNEVGMKARLEGSALIIEVEKVRKNANIGVQVDAEFLYSNPFDGVFELSLSGDLTIQADTGSLTFPSPTFGSTAPSAMGMPDAGIGADAGTGGGDASANGMAEEDAGDSPGESDAATVGASGDDTDGSSGDGNDMEAEPAAKSDSSDCSVGAPPATTRVGSSATSLLLLATVFALRARRRRTLHQSA